MLESMLSLINVHAMNKSLVEKLSSKLAMNGLIN